MALIPIYAKGTDDYSGNGLGLLTPLECTVEEQAAGMYELTLVQPIDETHRWAQIKGGCKVKAACPVRESPIYEAVVPDESQNTTVTREIYISNPHSRLRIRTKPSFSASIIMHLKRGREVIKVREVNSTWWEIIVCAGGESGYAEASMLVYSRTETDTVTPTHPVTQNTVQLEQSRDQLFTIYSVETDTEDQTVTAKAMHAFYDQRGNIIDAEYEPNAVDVSTVVSDIDSKLLLENPITWSVQGLTGNVSGTYSYKSPVEAYLDPDEGIIKQTKALLVRDNFTAYLIPDNVRDRGVTVRRRKNLKGVHATHDEADVVTRIIPVGKKKNGDPLYLSGSAYPTKYIDSPHIGDYPTVMAKRIEYDVSVGDPKDDDKDKVFKTEALAMAELKRRAEEEYSKNGIDLPAYGMEVDFILLQNTAEYANYASLQAVHLYDTVTVIDELIGLIAKVRVTGYKWNVLTGQYDSITLGELLDVQQTVYSYNLPDGGISGTKLVPGSVDGAVLRNASIQYAKIAIAAIQQLNAESITALTARLQEIVSDNITTDQLYAAIAEILALKVGSLNAQDIETDHLAAALAEFTVVTAGTASFDQATVKHLISEALNLTFGTAGDVFIENLRVKYAQMVSAAIGNLVIKASDGNYYQIDVNADGTVSAAPTTLSDDEISAGETDAGRVILATDITADSLNTANLLATYALINQIDAARIDVDQLFAREAFIALLRTQKIVGDKSIEMLAGELEQVKESVQQPIVDSETPPPAPLEEGKLWIDRGVTPPVLRRWRGLDVSPEDEDGWETINDLEEINKAAALLAQQQADVKAQLDQLGTALMVDSNGVHVYKPGYRSQNEVRIDEDSVDILVGGMVYASFIPNGLIVGGYRMWQPEEAGGLAFSPMEG